MFRLVFLPQAHLVAAFEQSLGNMTIRLKNLTLTAEQKVKKKQLLLDIEQTYKAHIINLPAFHPCRTLS